MVCFWGPVIPPHVEGAWKPRVKYLPKRDVLLNGNPSKAPNPRPWNDDKP